jgi:methyl-accepting chemotaxis protein PixJ
LNEGRRKKEEGRRFLDGDTEPQLKTDDPKNGRGIKPCTQIIILENSLMANITEKNETRTRPQPQNNSHLFAINAILSLVRGTRLRRKAIAFFIAIATLPVFGLGAVTHYLVKQSISKEISNVKQANAIDIFDNINRFLMVRKEELELFANLDFLANPKLREITTPVNKQIQLNNWQQIYKIYESIAIFDLNGEVLLQTKGERIPNQQVQEYFQAVLKTNRPYISHSLSTKSPEGYIYLVAPVKDKVTRSTISIIRAVISVKSLEKAINNPLTVQDKYSLIDSSGKIFIATNKNYLGRKFTEIFPALEQLQTEHKITSIILFNKMDNTEELITYIPWQKVEGLPELKWKLIVSNKAIVGSTERQLLLSLGIGTVATALLVGGISAILANHLMLPIFFKLATEDGEEEKKWLKK